MESLQSSSRCTKKNSQAARLSRASQSCESFGQRYEDCFANEAADTAARMHHKQQRINYTFDQLQASLRGHLQAASEVAIMA